MDATAALSPALAALAADMADFNPWEECAAAERAQGLGPRGERLSKETRPLAYEAAVGNLASWSAGAKVGLFLPLRALARLTLAATETSRSLGLAVGPRAMDQQAAADAMEHAWRNDQPEPEGGWRLGSRVAWAVGPPRTPEAILGEWHETVAERRHLSSPTDTARSKRSWATLPVLSALKPGGVA